MVLSKMFFYSGAIAVALAVGGVESASARARCAKSFVYLDLGDTILDTKTDHYNPMYYLPGAREFIAELAKKGHPVGLITDIPPEWGEHYPAQAPVLDRDSAQVLRMMDFIAGLMPEDEVSWRVGDAPFDWSAFGQFSGQGEKRVFHGRILLPHLKSERKDTGNPILFKRALRQAKMAGCRALYL
ncbi:MAG: hypothetical protein EOP09_10180, partial [Proteobacteria bacterium]